MVFSADETTDIGYESGTPVTPDYTPATSKFTGKINWVQIDLGLDSHDHLITPEERLRVDTARIGWILTDLRKYSIGHGT